MASSALTLASWPLLLAALLAAGPSTVTARTVNISSTWFLPQEGFPVFYRYFRDRITWFEADAVCQFHHANLVTVDNSVQFDTTRAYLKELDVVTNVWIGLKKGGPSEEFAWTDYKPLMHNGGYWMEQIPKTGSALCAAIDPAADFRWHSLNCGGPEVASFICELPVPPWARKEDGCMLTALPSLTVTFLPEQAAVELTSDCGLDGTRRIACKGQANRDEMVKQLSCDHGDSSPEDDNASSSTPGASSSDMISASSLGISSSASSGVSVSSSVSSAPRTSGTRAWSWAGDDESHEPPTRHRRDADDIASSLMLAAIGSTAAVSERSATTRAYEPTTISSNIEVSTAPLVSKTQLPSSAYTETPAASNKSLSQPYIISTVVVDTNKISTLNTVENLNLNTNHEEPPAFPPSTVAPTTILPQVETIKPIMNVHVPSLSEDLIIEQLQDTGNTNNAINPSPQEKDQLNKGNISSTSVPAAISQPLTPASPPEVKSSPVQATDTRVFLNETTNFYVNPMNKIIPTETSQMKNATEVVVLVPIQTKESTPPPTITTIAPISTTVENNITTTGVGNPKFLSPVFDDSKSSEEAEEQRKLKDQEEIRRRQFLPAPLRALSYGEEAKPDNATSTTRPSVDWAPIEEEGEVIEEEQEEPVEPMEAVEPVEPEPEIPARPNRGRRLTRPAQGRTFYPYFLNRVLG